MSAENNLPATPNGAKKLWKTALLLAGSGLLSGIAFALWNRRELSEIQSQRNTPATAEPRTEGEEEFY